MLKQKNGSKKKARRNDNVINNFGKYLRDLNSMSQSTTEKGLLFEKTIESFLKTDPLYRQRFNRVYMWRDYTDDKAEGVDLVAEGDEGICAIQCKFFELNNTLTKSHIDSFLETSKRDDGIIKKDGKKITFNSRILFHTSPIANDARRAISMHINSQIIGFNELSRSEVYWPDIKNQIFKITNKSKYVMKPHQLDALNAVKKHFKNNKRGKLLMACGTGKTFTSLAIAENIVGLGGIVLYLVPSISLMRQTIREWSEQKLMEHRYIAVCSDTKVGKNNEDITISEMEIPTTTDAEKLKQVILKKDEKKMLVIFSTYQSIGSVITAVSKSDTRINLALCDEAHRTTGLETEKIDKKNNKKAMFQEIHSDNNIKVEKRLYMTATKKIYSKSVKTKARRKEIKLFSMDDEEIYGPVFHELKFSDAIDKEILSDYRVIVITVSNKFASTLSESDMQLDDISKMIGCYKALINPDNKQIGTGTLIHKNALQKVIAYTNSIPLSEKFKKDFPVIASKLKPDKFTCSVKHVDGKQNSMVRGAALDWLDNSDVDENECRLISNAKCLNEGVDVPTLDAVLFLSPKKSMVEIVQAVGRVMRSSSIKKYGYVILPIVVSETGNTNEEIAKDVDYADLWDIVEALRSHDDRLDIAIDKMPITKKLPEQLIWQGIGKTGNKQTYKDGDRIFPIGGSRIPAEEIFAKFVEEVGDRRYLESWAKDVADIIPKIGTRIKTMMEMDSETGILIKRLQNDLKIIINDTVHNKTVIAMISQHMITSKIFETLFGNTYFIDNNPISKSLNNIVMRLEKSGHDAELEKLAPFYESIKKRVSDTNDHTVRQLIIKDLYSKFFQTAFPDMVKQLGIVYTPIEIIDFILKSTDYLSKDNFSAPLSSKNIKIIDPFVGTGGFITRLMSKDLGIIKKPNDLKRKYNSEIFAAEITLLGYYIAAINIESTYLQRISGKYSSFGGITLTDTFHQKKINEDWDDDLLSGMAKLIKNQKQSLIKIIVSNPPYHMEQEDEGNDKKITIKYELDNDIESTYVKTAKAIGVTQIRSLYDSYIRAIKWATVTIGDCGIIAFVTNSGFLRSHPGAGLRHHLANDFTKIYCFDLRGNQRTKGIESKKEGGKIFGSGSRTPITILLLLKDPISTKKHCEIRYKDIGDYLSREEKINEIKRLGSIKGIKKWTKISPDEFNDWLDQRDPKLSKYHYVGHRDKQINHPYNVIFRKHYPGISSGSDKHIYSFDPEILKSNAKKYIKLKKKEGIKVMKNKIRCALFRPFINKVIYFDTRLISRPSTTLNHFPKSNTQNPTIIIPHIYQDEPSVFITNYPADLHVINSCQCYPLYYYENGKKKCNITDEILEEYKRHYKNDNITAEQIFYYVYAMLHHIKYKEKFKNNLRKDLANIPPAPDFQYFSRTGRKLANLHLNFDKIKINKYMKKPKKIYVSINKLAFGKKRNNDGNLIDDKSIIISNDTDILFENIPESNYTVGGRTPLEWILEYYKSKPNRTDDEDVMIFKDNVIIANPFESIDIVDLLKRIIFVSKITDELITKLSRKEFEPAIDWKPESHGLEKYS